MGEALTRPTMRFVPLQTLDQQDLQSRHRARSLVVAQRTAPANQIRGLLGEYGLVLPPGIRALRQPLPALLEEADNGLTPAAGEWLSLLYQEWVRLDQRLVQFDQRIERQVQQDARCRRLLTRPGLGPLSASALVAALGDARPFRSGRALAAWLGLVPRPPSPGGRPVLLGISQRGAAYLRLLLLPGARAVRRHAARKTDPRSRWVVNVQSRRGHTGAAVALANKNARIARALLRQGTPYQPSHAA